MKKIVAAVLAVLCVCGARAEQEEKVIFDHRMGHDRCIDFSMIMIK